jgi:hypothetical protein
MGTFGLSLVPGSETRTIFGYWAFSPALNSAKLPYVVYD